EPPTEPAAPAPGTEDGATGRVVSGEVGDFLRAHEQRRRQLPRAILTGIVVGGIAVAFNRALAAADAARAAVVELAHAHPAWGMVLPVLLGALAAAVAVSLVRYVCPEASGSGIPQLKAVVHHLRTIRAGRVLGVKFVGGVVGIGGGLTLGREGPTIQMGGAVGQIVSRLFSCTPRERQTLITAGAGAGLGAAFNAPLSGLVFVLEEVQRDFPPTVFTATLIASATADVVTRSLTGQLPIFHVQMHGILPLRTLPVSLT